MPDDTAFHYEEYLGSDKSSAGKLSKRGVGDGGVEMVHDTDGAFAVSYVGHYHGHHPGNWTYRRGIGSASFYSGQQCAFAEGVFQAPDRAGRHADNPALFKHGKSRVRCGVWDCRCFTGDCAVDKLFDKGIGEAF